MTDAPLSLTQRLAALGVLMLFGYLSTVGLTNGPLSGDEAIAPVLARNLMATGSISADDGRNVLSFHDGQDIRENLTLRYPPINVFLQTGLLATFGMGGEKARLLMPLLTLIALLLFADVLRREFPGRGNLLVLALAFASLSPMTLGYARSATYNAPLLLCNILAFWAYVRYCQHPQIRHAALWLLVALAGFYTHWSGSAAFVAALVFFHLAFRRHRLTRRAQIIASLIVLIYAANVAALVAFDFPHYHYPPPQDVLSRVGETMTLLRGYLLRVNSNLILTYPVALWAIGYALYKCRQQAIRNDLGFQYLTLCLLAAAAMSIGTGATSIRYLSWLVPFGAVITAAFVLWSWRCWKPLGALACTLLLLTNISAQPFTPPHQTWGWSRPLVTLPALALEYHLAHELTHPPLREALAFLRMHGRQDEVVRMQPPFGAIGSYYLGDKFFLCCPLVRASSPQALRNDVERMHLFRDNLVSGSLKMDWALFLGDAPESRTFIINEHSYELVYDAPGAFGMRPEPDIHNAFPSPPDTPERLRIYRLVQKAK